MITVISFMVIGPFYLFLFLRKYSRLDATTASIRKTRLKAYHRRWEVGKIFSSALFWIDHLSNEEVLSIAGTI